MTMTRNDQLKHQAARNKALAEEYALSGDAAGYDWWMQAAGWLLAELT